LLQAIQEEELFGNASKFNTILDRIWTGDDYYLIAHDFPAYLEAQERVDECFKDQSEWLKKAILTTAGMGKFSSDRTIREYANEIWNVTPCGFSSPKMFPRAINTPK